MKKFLPSLIFGIVFGILEGIFVLYMREIYYPDGFQLPLVFLAPDMILVEIVREFCTIVMLGVIAWVSAKSLVQRFSVFLFAFAVWDIVYYLALKVFLNWPESLFTWDVLFLIPITWVSPVLAPVICSAGMIVIGLISVYIDEKIHPMRFTWPERLFIFAGVLMILFTYLYDYGRIIIENRFLLQFFSLADHEGFWRIVTNYTPGYYNWPLFAAGCLVIAVAYGWAFRRTIKSPVQNKP